MGLLAPLYALGALAIAGPIVFHLIRRQPQGQKQFSSLMFLSPSPPRLTRRSRLDQLWLLLLRALAIGLIAVAFARPYLREERLLNQSLTGREVVVVFDTSASMQRESVWNAALEQLDQLVDTLSEDDRVSLYTLDEQISPVVALDDVTLPDAAATQRAVRTAAATLEPTWFRTRLAEGIKSVADLLNAATVSGRIASGTEQQIVLISDLHQASGLEELQGYPWPEKVGLDVRRVVPAVTGNARPTLTQIDEMDAADGSLRVRIENNSDSDEQNLQLVWADASGVRPETQTRIQVPAGQIRMVTVSRPPSGADRLQLSGDAWDGDNELFFVSSEPVLQRIAMVAGQHEAVEEDPGYFLKKAPLDSPMIRREIQDVALDALSDFNLTSEEYAGLVIELVEVQPELGTKLRKLAESGAVVLVLLTKETTPEEAASFLDELWDISGTSITEVTPRDFAMIEKVDYRHPVFSSFSDPRFNDFSKIRFWSHRSVELPDSESLSEIAWLDDQSPLLIQQSLGRGMIHVLSAGWQPKESSLALSSKFVPMLTKLFDPNSGKKSEGIGFEVGQRIRWDQIVADGQRSEALADSGGADWPPDVALTTSSADDDGVATDEFYRPSRPGIYELNYEGETSQFVVHVPAEESSLTSLDPDVFEQYGVALGNVQTDQQRQDAARQMHVEELEQKQRLWQWLIAACLVVLVVETGLAGWFARQRVATPATE